MILVLITKVHGNKNTKKAKTQICRNTHYTIRNRCYSSKILTKLTWSNLSLRRKLTMCPFPPSVLMILLLFKIFQKNFGCQLTWLINSGPQLTQRRLVSMTHTNLLAPNYNLAPCCDGTQYFKRYRYRYIFPVPNIFYIVIDTFTFLFEWPQLIDWTSFCTLLLTWEDAQLLVGLIWAAKWGTGKV